LDILIKRFLPFVIVATVALAAVGSGITLYRAKRLPDLTVSKGAAADRSRAAMHVRGPTDAPVTLEEFGDFQCPPCGRLADAINQIERDYQPHLRVIFRDFPLAVHQHAHEAALAAEAAGLQGRFWEMHDLLYREQSAWSTAPDAPLLFERYAGVIGLDVPRFKKDIESEQVKARIAADQRVGASLGVTSTPSIFINGQPLAHSSLNPSGLRAAIDAAIKSRPTG
jgi:protein-disulfide isomerase